MKKMTWTDVLGAAILGAVLAYVFVNAAFGPDAPLPGETISVSK